jgi:hypothetical protein
MYKIQFNPEKCCWEIKLSKFYGLLWVTLKGKEFPNIISAEDYVQGVGLDKVYRNWQQSYTEYMMGGAR